jgi:integrase
MFSDLVGSTALSARMDRLLAAAKGTRQRALLLTAALTGLRASELRGLRWSDVDLGKAAELQVRQRADPGRRSVRRRQTLAPVPCRSPPS